jgi:tetratricopeptide (TPR) repeat protein
MKHRISHFPVQAYRQGLQLVSLCCLILLLSSCKKEWLNEKPDSHLVVLSSLSDYRSLMDDISLTGSSYLGEVGADNYYISETNLASLAATDIALYLWAPNGYGVAGIAAWYLYNPIFTCNTTLSALEKIERTPDNAAEYNSVYGSALFWRAFNYFELGSAFMKPYDSANAATDPGIPLRLEADITQKVGRGSVRQVYSQILSDLLEACRLLPSPAQAYKVRPNKGAAYAMLARVYLSMGTYDKALLYADSSLQLNNTLLDYNTVTPSTYYGLPAYYLNPEVLFYTHTGTNDLYITVARIDTLLYNSYSSGDLRKTLFFRMNAGIVFRGSYDGTSRSQFFTAPATDELYLIRSECYARTGNIPAAMNDLNTLLITRWTKGSFVPFTAGNTEEALTIILAERRKELVMRATRWTDLRRLNKDARWATTLTKIYKGVTYTLPPNDNKYVWPIPDDEILYSGIEQNPR